MMVLDEPARSEITEYDSCCLEWSIRNRRTVTTTDRVIGSRAVDYSLELLQLTDHFVKYIFSSSPDPEYHLMPHPGLIHIVRALNMHRNKYSLGGDATVFSAICGTLSITRNGLIFLDIAILYRLPLTFRSTRVVRILAHADGRKGDGRVDAIEADRRRRRG